MHSEEGPSRYFTARASRGVDHRAMTQFGIPGMVLMENAARSVAHEILSMDSMQQPDSNALIVCGPGNNGGDGWALARWLDAAGVTPRLCPLAEPDPGSDAGRYRSIAREIGFEEISLARCRKQPLPTVIVDAILGTGLTRPIDGTFSEAVRWINSARCPVVSIDCPSGIDVDSGRILGSAVRADMTVSFLGWKPGFLLSPGAACCGEVRIGEIGVPPVLLEEFGTDKPGGGGDEHHHTG